jgi:hypothetical protein
MTRRFAIPIFDILCGSCCQVSCLKCRQRAHTCSRLCVSRLPDVAERTPTKPKSLGVGVGFIRTVHLGPSSGISGSAFKPNWKKPASSALRRRLRRLSEEPRREQCSERRPFRTKFRLPLATLVTVPTALRLALAVTRTPSRTHLLLSSGTGRDPDCSESDAGQVRSGLLLGRSLGP